MSRIILGLGSNKGDKKDYVCQDDFFNMVLEGEYEGTPFSLLEKKKKIEARNGRNREKEIPKGPRTLDIDILFFGDISLNMPNLIIPHPQIEKRAFVVIPLLELFPDFTKGSISYKKLLPVLEAQRVDKISSL